MPAGRDDAVHGRVGAGAQELGHRQGGHIRHHTVNAGRSAEQGRGPRAALGRPARTFFQTKCTQVRHAPSTPHLPDRE